jgi:hypothetical protein
MFPVVFTWFDKLTAAARANAHPDAGKDISPEEARNVAEKASKAGQFIKLAEKFVDINGRQKGDVVAWVSFVVVGCARSDPCRLPASVRTNSEAPKHRRLLPAPSSNQQPVQSQSATQLPKAGTWSTTTRATATTYSPQVSEETTTMYNQYNVIK